MGAGAEFALVGRELELAQLRLFVKALAERSGGALVRGDAGIGKTTLWRAAVEATEQAGVRVLHTRCSEAEMPMALGGLGDLLDDVLRELADELAEPQRTALAVAVGLEAPFEDRADAVSLPRAFLACLKKLAEQSPVLLAIDDVQWLDPPSRRIVAFAVRRLERAPVSVLATQRGNAADPLDLHHAFDERFLELHVGPMSVGALHHLIRTRLGARIPRPALARVHAASGGNPMFALEFARVASSGGAPLPVPPSLEELVRVRMTGLPPDALRLLAAVAAAERPTLMLLEEVVDDASHLLDTASAEHLVTSDGDGVVRFAHPLLASAAYAAVSSAAKQELHARLASATSDPEVRGRHLALATLEPDADVAELLDEAALRARSRGAPDAAADLARQALRLTPPGDAAAIEERTITVASYLTDAGQMAAAGAVLADLLAGPIAGTRRARALLLAFFAESDVEKARGLAEEALDHAGGDLALRARALLSLGSYPARDGDLAQAERIVRDARRAADRVGEPALLAAALTCLADVSDLQGRPDPALLLRATALLGDDAPLRGYPSPKTALARQELSAGNLDNARVLLEAELAAARRLGNEELASVALLALVDVEWRAGDWDLAERHIDDHWQLVFDTENRFGEALLIWRQALLAASRGHVEDAQMLALRAVSRGGELNLPPLTVQGRWVLGFLALSLDKPQEAWDALRIVAERPELAGRLDPRLVPLLPDAIEALVVVGRPDEAEGILKTLDEYAQALEHRWATPASARCRALLLLAQGDSKAAVAAAEEAASGFEAIGFPLDRGRALLVAGEGLRRMGERRRAADILQAARQAFSELGAPLWRDRAEKEARRASPRPRRDGELTTAERRVAALVAGGLTNREAAAQLFTTVGTVEVHLTRIYRKLDLRSRTELARRVADGTLDLADV